ncbi:MAG: T9SS type A sorting domain-containing protein [Bacteroidia bacterium]|nr:T9SS type A sorting domain-containing protein [Bacteroidia bacterium]
MKPLRPLLVTLLLTTVLSISSALCPIHYVILQGYVQYPSEHVTKKEIVNLNFDDIKDSAHVALAEKQIEGFTVYQKTIGDERPKYVGYCGSNGEVSLEEAFRSMLDTVLPALNFQDTLLFTYYMNDKEGGKDLRQEEVFFYGGFGQFKMNQTFVISSQAVVDLKRAPEGTSVVAYPSPAEGYVSIRFNVKEQVAGSLQLVNSLGQEVERVDHNNLMEPYTFDIQSEPAGTYFIRAIMDGESFLTKFIKE